MIHVLVSVVALTAIAQPSAQYKLDPGRHLTYEAEYTTKDADGTLKYTLSNTLELWVLESTEDGGWRTLACNTRAFNTPNGGTGNETVSATVVEVLPNGRYEANPLNPLDQFLSNVFIPLPASPEEMQHGWTTIDPYDPGPTYYRLIEGGGDKPLVIDVRETGPMIDVYQQEGTCTRIFDLNQGLITSGQVESDGWSGSMSHTSSTLKLTGDETLSAEALEQLMADARLFADTMAAYEKVQFDPPDSRDEAEKAMSNAKSDLDRLAAAVKSDVIRTQTEEVLKQHDSMAQYIVETAEHVAAQIGKAAPPWEYPDMEGNTRKLSDYAGKVVLLDFWYRGCGWCIRAMPQLKDLAEAYKDKPVAIIGVNVDRDEKDARFVVETIDLPYTNILTGPMGGEDTISKRYGVEGYPTMVIVDQEGTIRDFHVGYRPTLKEDLSKLIDGMLD